MFNKEKYLTSIRESVVHLIKLYEEFYFFNCLKENIDISNNLDKHLSRLYLIKSLMKPDSYEMFYKMVEDFVLGGGALDLSLLLLSHPRKDSLVQIKNEYSNFGYSYEVSASNPEDLIQSVNSNYLFLFYLKNEEGFSNKLMEYWRNKFPVKEELKVFYRLQDNVGKEVSLQIMPFEDFTFDVINLKESKNILSFLNFLLKENEELKDKINISFRKQLGNGFSLF